MARQMKDSGIEWIGEIPENWGIYTAFQVFSPVKSKNIGMQENNLLSLSYGRIIQKDINTTFGLLPESFEGYNIIEPNDIVLRLTDLQNDHTSLRVGLSEQRGIITSAYLTLRVMLNCSPKYLYYQLHSFDICKGLYGMGAGVRQGLNWEGIKLLKIVMPNICEQERIVDFLDHQCAEIDAVIAKTKATIEEYKRLKQAVITEAVTKGIRGDRPMKDSGIEWIGEIPADWGVSRIKYVAVFEPNIDRSNLTEDSIITYTPMEYIKNGYFINNTATLGSVSSTLTSYQEGDIVMAKVTPCFENGNIAIMNNLLSGFGVGSSELFVFRATQIQTNYLFYWLRNDKFVQSACSSMTGTGGLKRVPPSFVENCYLHFPLVEEQQEIADYLDRKCAEIDVLIARKTALLDELEAYKKSVIYEYVTGKREVTVVSVTQQAAVIYPFFPVELGTDKPRFAQAVLMSRILDKCRKKMGRVKLVKMSYVIESSIGFDFDTEYAREVAGPLHSSIYQCENYISRSNKWYNISKSNYGVSYKPAQDKDKYLKYYNSYFSDYDSEIERIIQFFMGFDAEQAEIVATLFGAWNDAIIDQRQYTDDDIVDDVLENWNDSKRRISRERWLRAMEHMRKQNMVPKGYGKRTVIKEG